MNTPKKRRHKRSSTLVLFNIESTHNPNKTGRAAVIDISLSGAAFVGNIEFSEGEEVDLRFILPGYRVYVLEGVIRRIQVRNDAYMYGVEFKNLNFIKKIRLRKLISKIRNS